MCFDVQNPVDISINDLHNNARVSLLNERRDLNLLCIMYDLKQLHLYERTRDRETRQGKTYIFQTYIALVGIYTRSPYYVGSKLWNNIPSNIQNTGTKAQFKHELKTLWG